MGKKRERTEKLVKTRLEERKKQFSQLSQQEIDEGLDKLYIEVMEREVKVCKKEVAKLKIKTLLKAVKSLTKVFIPTAIRVLGSSFIIASNWRKELFEPGTKMLILAFAIKASQDLRIMDIKMDTNDLKEITNKLEIKQVKLARRSMALKKAKIEAEIDAKNNNEKNKNENSN